MDENMRCQTLSLSTRLTALIVLAAWTASMAFCSTACRQGDCHSQPSEPKHEHSDVSEHNQDAHEHSHDSSPGHSPNKCPDEQSVCNALTSTVLPSAFVFIPSPQLVTAILPSIHLETLTQVRLRTECFRQVSDFNFIFTPEVCLGPAFRTHAPPSLA